MQYPKMLKNLEQQLKTTQLKKHIVEVGWFDPDFAKIAGINEYGAVIDKKNVKESKNDNEENSDKIVIPPRPHRQHTINTFKDHWKKFLALSLKKTNYNVAKSMQILSIEMVQNYKSIFTDHNNFVKNAESTLRARKYKEIASTIPLFATGELQRHIEGKAYDE